jgi:hypothetical protein
MLKNEEKNENAVFVSFCGDIDLTAFSENPNLKDTWARQVRDMLENEEKNENVEFRVKKVEYIQAEVGPF